MGMFKKAIKAQAYLRMALAGPSGSGKTYTALSVAEALADDKPVAVIDTERGSASKYSDLFSFDVLELESFEPDRYVEAIRAAVGEGYAVVIVDSLSHAWNGKGGLLEQVEKLGKMRYNGNSFKAWGDVKPIENRLIEAITGSPIHVIATMRSKTEYVVEQNDRGKATPRKVGMAPIQRDGMEYEFDVFGEMNPDNELMIQKTRCSALTGALIAKPGKGLAETLRTWLSGTPVTPPTAPKPAPRMVEMTPVETVADDDDEAETIPYTPDDDEPAARVRQLYDGMTRQQFLLATAEMGYSPRRVMEMLGVRSLDGLNLSQSLEQIRAKASAMPAKKAVPTRRSHVSSLGAVTDPGESVPPSLESLPTGSRAS